MIGPPASTPAALPAFTTHPGPRDRCGEDGFGTSYHRERHRRADQRSHAVPGHADGQEQARLTTLLLHDRPFRYKLTLSVVTTPPPKLVTTYLSNLRTTLNLWSHTEVDDGSFCAQDPQTMKGAKVVEVLEVQRGERQVVGQAAGCDPHVVRRPRSAPAGSRR
jgi:hypothetical protein